jgi:hypothetical protein
MRSMIFVKLLAMAALVGCSVPIKSTLDTAQSECAEMKAIIKNVDGLESVVIKCTWNEEVQTWD